LQPKHENLEGLIEINILNKAMSLERDIVIEGSLQRGDDQNNLFITNVQGLLFNAKHIKGIVPEIVVATCIHQFNFKTKGKAVYETMFKEGISIKASTLVQITTPP